MHMKNLGMSLSLIWFLFLSFSLGAGDIRGKVYVGNKENLKIAKSYSEHSSAHSKSIQPVPPVVFIEGKIEGVSFLPDKNYLIVQEGLNFNPGLLVIPVNALVEFPNKDNEFHNVFSYSKTKRFDLGRYPKGEFKTMRFEKPGIVKVYCEVHPWMRAAILVMENPFYSVAAGDGSFLIRDVPDGEYTLIIWDMDFGIRRKKIIVSGEPLEITADLRKK